METFKPICNRCNKTNISIIEFCKNANGLYYDCCRTCLNLWVRNHYNQIKENRQDIFDNR